MSSYDSNRRGVSEALGEASKLSKAAFDCEVRSLQRGVRGAVCTPVERTRATRQDVLGFRLLVLLGLRTRA